MNRFPVWLVCLILFIILLGGAFFVLPKDSYTATPRSVQTALPFATVEPFTEASPSLEITDLPPAVSEDIFSSTPTPELEGLQSEEPAAAEVTISEVEEELPTLHAHHFIDGVCETCGKKLDFYLQSLPEELFEEAEHRGTVTRYEYTCPAYGGSGEYHKCINIYTPYDYDPAKHYNVLVLIHGGDGDENSWLTDVYPYNEHELSGVQLLDRMFELGYCDPCLVVCPVMETEELVGVEPGMIQMRDELRQDILPWVAENYSTWAADGSLESLQAAREHFALGGLSNGALFVWYGGLSYNFDLFGSYMPLSGVSDSWQALAAIRSDEWIDLPIVCFFTGAGDNGSDWNYNGVYNGYYTLLNGDSRFVEGQNSFRVDIRAGHDWRVWFTDLCNALPLMFYS